jgi:hypothetical protein
VAIAATPFLGVVGWVIAAQAVFGLCNGFGNTYTVTAFQRWAPAGSLGRLNGLLLFTSFGMAPVSVLLAAWFARAFGPAAFFVFAAVTIAMAVLWGLTQRAWRGFGATPPARPVPARQVPVPQASCWAWLCRVRRPSGLVARVVPSGWRVRVQPRR